MLDVSLTLVSGSGSNVINEQDGLRLIATINSNDNDSSNNINTYDYTFNCTEINDHLTIEEIESLDGNSDINKSPNLNAESHSSDKSKESCVFNVDVYRIYGKNYYEFGGTNVEIRSISLAVKFYYNQDQQIHI